VNIAIIGSHGFNVVYGGFETFIRELIINMSDRDINFIVYERPHTIKLLESYDSNKISRINISTLERKNLAQFIHSFKSTFHSFFIKCDIILYVNIANAPFAFLQKVFTSRKIIICVDGIEWRRKKWNIIGKGYFYLSARLAKYSAHNLIADSNEIVFLYKNQFKTETKYISYGANTYISESEVIEFETNSYYLIIGRIIPDNNIAFLIKQLLESNTKKKIVIVGELKKTNNYHNEIIQMEDNRIVKLGLVTSISRLNQLLKNCFCYLHGHEYGGTNPILLQALGNGALSLALNTIYNREVISDKYGLLFEKKTFTNQINNIESNKDDYSQIKILAKEYINEKYNWKTVAEQYYELFQN
jgi:glycosyltransferase involved in cell wall biosynthesis